MILSMFQPQQSSPPGPRLMPVLHWPIAAEIKRRNLEENIRIVAFTGPDFGPNILYFLTWIQGKPTLCSLLFFLTFRHKSQIISQA